MFEPVRLAIANYIQANWAGVYPMFAENQGEKQPAGFFARYTIRPVTTVSMAVGAQNQKYRRTTALLWFQFFGIDATGTTDAMKFGDLIALMFDEKWIPTSTGSVIRFQRSELQYVGIEPSGRPHWKCTVRYTTDDL